MRHPDHDNQLAILLENGCLINEQENVKYCNFLLEIKDDPNVETEMKTKAENHFSELDCNKEDACNYCFIPPPPGPPGPPPPGPPPPCTNTKPSSCQVTQNVGLENLPGMETPQNLTQTITNNENATAGQPNGPNQLKRRKRQGGFGPSDPLKKVDFDTDASFIKMMMEIPAEYRFEIISFLFTMKFRDSDQTLGRSWDIHW